MVCSSMLSLRGFKLAMRFCCCCSPRRRSAISRRTSLFVQWRVKREVFQIASNSVPFIKMTRTRVYGSTVSLSYGLTLMLFQFL